MFTLIAINNKGENSDGGLVFLLLSSLEETRICTFAHLEEV